MAIFLHLTEQEFVFQPLFTGKACLVGFHRSGRMLRPLKKFPILSVNSHPINPEFVIPCLKYDVRKSTSAFL
jgi:hypothetical protein